MASVKDATKYWNAETSSFDPNTPAAPHPTSQPFYGYESPLQTYKKGWVNTHDPNDPNNQRFANWLPNFDSQWGVADYWGEQGKKYSNDPSRLWAQGARQLSGRGLGQMQDIATGKQSFVDAAQQNQINAIRARAQSQAKSQAGGYNPAAARTANYLSSGARSMTAPGAAVARQAEQLNAANQWLQGAAAMRGNETDWWTKQAAWNNAKSAMDQRAHAMGRGDKETIRGQRMSYQDMLLGQQQQQNALNTAQSNADYQFLGQNLQSLGPLFQNETRKKSS